MIASRDIKQGELILSEEPLLQLPPGLEENTVMTQKYLKQQMSSFTRDQLNEYMAL
ncbi:hypothetical protein FRB90_002214, partial [Tulasnella sp. 427]